MVGYKTLSHRALFSKLSATEKIFLAASRAPLAKTGHVAAYAIQQKHLIMAEPKVLAKKERNKNFLHLKSQEKLV